MRSADDIERIAELEAHAERLWEAFDEAMELHREACAQDGEWPMELRLASAVWSEGNAPATSLARRDAEQQKVGAASFRHEVMESVKAPFRPHIQGVFDVWLRRQAEESPK